MADTALLQQRPTTAVRDHAVPDTVACPECGRVAAVTDRFVLASTDGPVEHSRLRCDAGRHHLTLNTAGG